MTTSRACLGDFPTRLRLDAQLRTGRWTGRLWTDHHQVDLEQVRSIWYRNPATYSFPASLTIGEQDFCYREAKLGLGGVLACLDVLWANPPHSTAIFKPYQWKVAAECGLTVADTVITNDPDSARRFITQGQGETITKALGPSGIIEDGQAKVAYTRRLTTDDVADLDAVAVTATTLQPCVPKAFEVRLTVIGADWFPIALHAHSDTARQD